MKKWQEVPPAIYYSDVDESTTRYEVLLASPRDGERLFMWQAWAGVALITSLICGVLLMAILRSPKARKNMFNWYLVYLIVPDIVFSLNCGITCLTNAIVGQYMGEWMCQYQAFYSIFGISANSWINALVARQLFLMLQTSGTFRQYHPPTLQQVTHQAMAVYLFSALLAILPLLHDIVPWLPHQTRLIVGLACLPVATNVGSEIFFYLFFCPLLVAIPLGLVLWIFAQILWYQKLLPPMGRRRLLAIYFLRLAVVFVVMWVPGVAMIYFRGGGGSRWSSPWISWVGGSWSHLQGSVSALVSLLKPDVQEAVYDLTLGNLYYYCGCLFGCCCRNQPDNQCQGNNYNNNDDQDNKKHHRLANNMDNNNNNPRSQSETWLTKGSSGATNFDSLFDDQSRYNSVSQMSRQFFQQGLERDTEDEQQNHHPVAVGIGYSLASSVLPSRPMVDLEAQQQQRDEQLLTLPSGNQISSIRFSLDDGTITEEEDNVTTTEKGQLPMVDYQFPGDDGKDRLSVLTDEVSKERDRLPIEGNRPSSMKEREDRLPIVCQHQHHDNRKDDDNNNNNRNNNNDSTRLVDEHQKQFDTFRRNSQGFVSTHDLDAIEKILRDDEEELKSRIQESNETSRLDKHVIEKIQEEEERKREVEKQLEIESMSLVRRIMEDDAVELEENRATTLGRGGVEKEDQDESYSDGENDGYEEDATFGRFCRDFPSQENNDDDNEAGNYDCRVHVGEGDDNIIASVEEHRPQHSGGSDILPYETCLRISKTLGDVRLENWERIAEEEIGRLPVEFFDSSEERPSNHPCETTCLICQHSYVDDDLLRRLACNHCFHVSCVDAWLMKNDTCPYCRKIIDLA